MIAETREPGVIVSLVALSVPKQIGPYGCDSPEISPDCDKNCAGWRVVAKVHAVSTGAIILVRLIGPSLTPGLRFVVQYMLRRRAPSLFERARPDTKALRKSLSGLPFNLLTRQGRSLSCHI